jgi:integrase
VKYILETCSTLFNYARRQRHLSPYADNPLLTIEIGRIPVEDAKPITVFDRDTERRFFQVCDAWQLPVFLTLLLTGLRPGELVHLLLPEDLDLETGWLHVRNKPKLGWQVKTRNERSIPLAPVSAVLLRRTIGERCTGPVFRQRRCDAGYDPPLGGLSTEMLAREIERRAAICQSAVQEDLQRHARQTAARTVWRDMGALRTDWIRTEFMQLTAVIGMPEVTAPKTLRHTFATILQDANVDPLIRNELMGHSPAAAMAGSTGLGMTTRYTHTRSETKSTQLEAAICNHPPADVAMRYDSIH